MIDISLSQEFDAAGVFVRLGCLQFRVEPIDCDEALSEALELEIQRARTLLSVTGPSEFANIAAGRRAYRACGKDPTRYRLSSEALMRRIRSGKGLYRINPVVDTNTLVSLHTGLSLGCYDLSALKPPLQFRPGREGESYTGIGRGPFNLEKLPVLVDALGPFGSSTSDSERSRVGPDTAQVLMVLIDFGAEGDLSEPLAFAAESLERFCNARELRTWTVVSPGKSF